MGMRKIVSSPNLTRLVDKLVNQTVRVTSEDLASGGANFCSMPLSNKDSNAETLSNLAGRRCVVYWHGLCLRMLLPPVYTSHCSWPTWRTPPTRGEFGGATGVRFWPPKPLMMIDWGGGTTGGVGIMLDVLEPGLVARPGVWNWRRVPERWTDDGILTCKSEPYKEAETDLEGSIEPPLASSGGGLMAFVWCEEGVVMVKSWRKGKFTLIIIQKN